MHVLLLSRKHRAAPREPRGTCSGADGRRMLGLARSTSATVGSPVRAPVGAALAGGRSGTGRGTATARPTTARSTNASTARAMCAERTPPRRGRRRCGVLLRRDALDRLQRGGVLLEFGPAARADLEVGDGLERRAQRRDVGAADVGD